jgi:hypothetical protein
MKVFYELERDDRFMSRIPAPTLARSVLAGVAVLLAGLIGLVIAGSIYGYAPDTGPVFDFAWNLMAP